MKKVVLVILLTLMIVGCGKVEKFYLEDELYEQGKITEITVNEFKKLEEEKKSFAVFVYLPGCTSCAEFRTVLEQFVEDNNLEVYTISILDTDNTSISEVVEYAPSLVLYNKGEMVDYLDSTSDKDKPALTSVDGLDNWLEEYIYFSIN
ncbi:MAG: thioredoxin domain-containing protein [Candidatus Coprovivens sp.]